MRTRSLFAISFTFAFCCVAACGGEVSSGQDNGQSRAAAAADCPNVAPQQGTACANEATRCGYPVDFCAHEFECTCTADRGWICAMPAECVSR